MQNLKLITKNLKLRTQDLLRIQFVRDTITLQAGKITLVGINAVASIILIRGLGAYEFGVYALVLTLNGLLLTFDLTGLGLSTLTRLAEAIAAGNQDQTRDLMAFFIQTSLVIALVASSLAFGFGPWFAEVSYGNATIGELMRFYTLTLFLLPVYQLMLIVLQSARAMRAYALLENGGTLLDAALTVPAVLAGLGAAGVIAAYLLSALIKAVGSVWAYRRLQGQRPAVLPALGEILKAARTHSPRDYWAFGVKLAVDKKLADLFVLLPQQLLGMWAGEAAAGFLKLALSALARPSLIFSGILTNLAARVPADVGRRDYARLRVNFRRVALWVVPSALGLFGAFALAAPIAVPLLVGEEYVPVVPLIAVLSLYGALTGIGGIFGPLYRSLRLMRRAILVKALSLVVNALPAVWLISTYGALGGAWTINLVFAMSVALTIAVTWPHMRRLAEQQAREVEPVGKQPSAIGDWQ